MQIRFNLAPSQTGFYLKLCNLDNGARCTETSVSITYISCLMYLQIVSYKNFHSILKMVVIMLHVCSAAVKIMLFIT